MESQNSYLAFIKNWYWLIALGVLVALVATHLAISGRPVVYRSTATLQVGRTVQNQSPDQNEMATIDRLVTVYGELATREPALEAVIDTLELPMSVEQLRSRMLITTSPSTQLIDITVIDSDAEFAATLANEIARQVVLTSPSPTADSESQRFLQSQLDDLQGKIIEVQAEIEETETSIVGMTSAADIYDAQQRLEVLNAQLDSWQETFGTLLNQLEPSATNIVRIISDAEPAGQPQQQQTMLYYGFAVVMGAGLASLLALGLTQFDRSLRSGQAADALELQCPVIDVPFFRIRKTSALVALRDPQSDAASAYRVVRNKVKIGASQSGARALVVTSPRAGEGKTTTAANLGIALANSGSLVFLVDANFRNPELDELFGFEAKQGFSDLLLGTSNVMDVVLETEHPYLWVIGVGALPFNYLDILASDHIETVVAKLLDHADVVIFDTPALGQEQETQLLAKVVGEVVLIAESAHTTMESLTQARNQLTNIGAGLRLVVFNKVRKPWHARLMQWPWSRERRLESRASERRRRRLSAAHPGVTTDDLPAGTSAD